MHTLMGHRTYLYSSSNCYGVEKKLKTTLGNCCNYSCTDNPHQTRTFVAEYVVRNGRTITSDIDDRLTITPPPLQVEHKKECTHFLTYRAFTINNHTRAGKFGEVLIWRFGKFGKDCQIKNLPILIIACAPMALRFQITKFNTRQTFPLYYGIIHVTVIQPCQGTLCHNNITILKWNTCRLRCSMVGTVSIQTQLTYFSSIRGRSKYVIYNDIIMQCEHIVVNDKVSIDWLVPAP